MPSLKPETWSKDSGLSDWWRWNVREEIAGFWVRYKNGNPKYFHEYDVTWLNQCDGCGRIGVPRRVAYRYVGGVPWDLNWCLPYLCMGCFNRARAIVRRAKAIAELTALTDRLASAAWKARRQPSMKGTT